MPLLGLNSSAHTMDTTIMVITIGLKHSVRNTTTPRSFWLSRMARNNARDTCTGTTTSVNVRLLRMALKKVSLLKMRR